MSDPRQDDYAAKRTQWGAMVERAIGARLKALEGFEGSATRLIEAVRLVVAEQSNIANYDDPNEAIAKLVEAWAEIQGEDDTAQ
jgi:hypothetical protein